MTNEEAQLDRLKKLIAATNATAERRQREAQARVQRFLHSGQWPERQVPDPVPDPKVPWYLSLNDKRFLRSIRVAPEG